MINRHAIILALSLSCLQFAPALADELLTFNGGKIQCTVLQESETAVTTLIGESVIRFQQNDIKSVVRNSKVLDRPESTTTGIPAYSYIMPTLAKQAWAVDLHQIPATVIDKGVLKHVPYKSHRVAVDCEINVYGDPQNPAGVEVGLLGKYLSHDKAKERCLQFVSSLLNESTDRAILAAIKREKDLVVHGDLTFEITPPTADDAYKGWWISVYSEKALDSFRASDEELQAITTKHIAPEPVTDVPSAPPAPSVVRADAVDIERWSPSDYGYARPVTSNSSSSTSGGRVYVRGYYRKDGTYVRPHTRRK
jgi:hypothetical protein